MSYRGRFAPSPTGPLHAGSLVAALASWLDARAHGGQWLVRIEDVDTPRCIPGADRTILGQLAACGLQPDEPPMYQSQRHEAYRQALNQLKESGDAYPCGCTRQDIDAALAAAGTPRQRSGERVYPGTCRLGLHGKPARAWRFNTFSSGSKRLVAHTRKPLIAPESIAEALEKDDDECTVNWHDRLLGQQQQDVCREVGDFILRRADGFWAYQLAVVVDDAAQGITHVVRGADLADNTARQIMLQRALGLPQPAYLHTPLVLAADGEKLSKQNGASALDVTGPGEALKSLTAAGRYLSLCHHDTSTTDWLLSAISQWRDRSFNV